MKYLYDKYVIYSIAELSILLLIVAYKFTLLRIHILNNVNSRWFMYDTPDVSQNIKLIIHPEFILRPQLCKPVQCGIA